jgi:hypothetical protein
MTRNKQDKPIHQLTAAQFDKLFPNEDACAAYLVARRWPEGVRCPRCGNPAVYDLPSNKWHWQCTKCAPGGSMGYRFSHIAGTIFENTNKPLKDWFRVIHLMLVSKKGMSALQIYRYMGFGSYKTAWEMCHKIRTALIEDIGQLAGVVEVDETFVGGKAKNRHWDKRGDGTGGTGGAGKAIVVWAVRRKGNVIARVIDNVQASNHRNGEPIAVVAAIGKKRFGRRQGVEDQSRALVIAHLALAEQQDERLAVAVADGVEFRVQAAFRAPDTPGNIPFFRRLAAVRCAFRWVASIMIRSGLGPWPARAANILSNTPSRLHRMKRL